MELVRITPPWSHNPARHLGRAAGFCRAASRAIVPAVEPLAEIGLARAAAVSSGPVGLTALAPVGSFVPNAPARAVAVNNGPAGDPAIITGPAPVAAANSGGPAIITTGPAPVAAANSGGLAITIARVGGPATTTGQTAGTIDPLSIGPTTALTQTSITTNSSSAATWQEPLRQRLWRGVRRVRRIRLSGVRWLWFLAVLWKWLHGLVSRQLVELVGPIGRLDRRRRDQLRLRLALGGQFLRLQQPVLRRPGHDDRAAGLRLRRSDPGSGARSNDGLDARHDRTRAATVSRGGCRCRAHGHRTAGRRGPGRGDSGPESEGGDGCIRRRSRFIQGRRLRPRQMQVETAIGSEPADPVMHEFRPLTLFAQGKYREAAATLYAVLARGPGWDWNTMLSLYPDADTYTRQLRALEETIREHPSDGAARFVLAYHYLVTRQTDAAVRQLREVVKLTPDNTLAADMIKALTSAPTGGEVPKAGQ